MNNKWFRKLFRMRMFISMLIILQLTFIIFIIANGSKSSQIFTFILTLASVVTVLYIVAKEDKTSYKMTWVVLILSFPLFGGFMYSLFHYQSSTKRFEKYINNSDGKVKQLALLPETAYQTAIEQLPEQISQIKYLQKFANFPIYSNTKVTYLTPGETKFKYLLEALENARKYIFLEYFIIQEGLMWNKVLDILKRKVKEGVLVRVIYDDMGCFFTLPVDYCKQLRNFGIECTIFNPFRPVLTVRQNNRDHRKIAVIDGKIAFTGGINLADEYINAVEKHGHWKDASIMLEGKAAWSLTLIFLQMWELCTHIDEDYNIYYPWKKKDCDIETKGFVQPYADSPIDTEHVGENVYLKIINNAKKYIYINTPYLIVDESVLDALCLAAKSGVDIKIVTPHCWDKWLVHMTTRSYYRQLLDAGIEIYEYTNGFMHSKTFVSDDIISTVGTTNLDFRSLYLHFECGTVLYNDSAVFSVRDDFMQTLSLCHKISKEDCKTNVFFKLFQDILHLFAPLM